MISDYRCFFCFTRAFEKLLVKEDVPLQAKNSFTNEMISLYHNNRERLTAPEFARALHNILKVYTRNHDPYRNEKKESNDEALGMIPQLKKIIESSADPFNCALRLAIAGNIIDFAANDDFNLKATIDRALKDEFAIDHSAQLKEALSKAENILYLGDNAGEIVFDKLFIDTLGHPGITYAVRGAPVINDATMEDALYTGMQSSARVISNGYDAPSTIVGKSAAEFREYFDSADLIISKGQGNLEGLIDGNDSRIFYLLMVKCDVIAELLNVRKESLVVFNTAEEQMRHDRD